MPTLRNPVPPFNRGRRRAEGSLGEKKCEPCFTARWTRQGLEQHSLPRREPDSEPDAFEHYDGEHRALDQHGPIKYEGATKQLSTMTENTWSIEDTDVHSAVGHAVVELKSYFKDWSRAQHDDFWQRKSHKTVLAVVVCRSSDCNFTVHRGMNTEVSLACGSLCAERAAIANAASCFHAAHEIEAIAVLDPNDHINPLWPCEVCQSWLAKLREQSSAIGIIAVTSPTCESFIVRVNGQLLPAPRQALWPQHDLVGQIELAEGTKEWPWEARELIYVHGAWTPFTAKERHFLRNARTRGTHLLVGIHSDATHKEHGDEIATEDFESCCSRLIDNRHVSSILKGAPLCITETLIRSLGIHRVMMMSTDEDHDKLKDDTSALMYRVPQKLGILAFVPKITSKF